MTEDINPLFPPRLVFDENNPFNGDLFNRRHLANQLTGYLERLRDGTVIAIDAPWGEGKSWFGKNWAADLKTQEYRVVFLDAFQQDYIEDPFLLIASEINQLTKSDKSTSDDLKHKASKVMKAILPLSTKLLVNATGRFVLGSANLTSELEKAIESANEDMADTTQKWVEDKIESYAEDRKSLDTFRDALKSYCESQEKPVIFFIDELDRCRPDFAVKLIERLKHFFDVPNLVFVLMLNQKQLENAVEGVYGGATDSEAYLRKFIHMSLSLPKNVASEREQSNANWKYLHQLAKHYKFPVNQYIEQFINNFSAIASITNMSLRDLEKAMALLALNGIDSSASYLAWPVFLKLKYSSIFHGILNRDVSAHIKAADILDKMNISENFRFWIKKYFVPYHIKMAHGYEKLTLDQRNELDQYNPTGYFTDEDPLQIWLKRLDIANQE